VRLRNTSRSDEIGEPVERYSAGSFNPL